MRLRETYSSLRPQLYLKRTQAKQQPIGNWVSEKNYQLRSGE
jgi:hypothetical protein